MIEFKLHHLDLARAANDAHPLHPTASHTHCHSSDVNREFNAPAAAVAEAATVAKATAAAVAREAVDLGREAVNRTES